MLRHLLGVPTVGSKCLLLPLPLSTAVCQPCRAEVLLHFLPSSLALQGQWHTRAGSFKSIMAIVTPCRSDQSTLGLAPFSHLSDGRIQLVLVKECSILQYLQFLASIPQSGRHGSGSRRKLSSSSMAFATCGVVADRLASHFWAASYSSWCLVPWRASAQAVPLMQVWCPASSATLTLWKQQLSMWSRLARKVGGTWMESCLKPIT